METKFIYDALVLNRRVDFHVIGATPARWRGNFGSSPLDTVVDFHTGTDRMTIPPPLLELLAGSEEPVPRKLEPSRAAAACADAELVYDESSFRLAMNADLAATTKLAEGINAFIGETAKLQAAIEAKV